MLNSVNWFQVALYFLAIAMFLMLFSWFANLAIIVHTKKALARQLKREQEFYATIPARTQAFEMVDRAIGTGYPGIDMTGKHTQEVWYALLSEVVGDYGAMVRRYSMANARDNYECDLDMLAKVAATCIRIMENKIIQQRKEVDNGSKKN